MSGRTGSSSGSGPAAAAAPVPRSVDAKRQALLELRLRDRRPAGPAADAASETAPAEAAPLVTLIPDGERAPLFCVHPSGGSAAPYLPLAETLGPGRGFHALEAPGLYGGRPLADLDALCARYLDAISVMRPAGPYLLGGWSAGGTIALELARRLRERGQQVSMLVLIDTRPDPSPGDAGAVLASFAADVALQHDRPPPRLDPATLARQDPAGAAAAVAAALEDTGLVPAGLRAETLRRLEVFLATTSAVGRYRARRYDGPATLVTAAETPPALMAGWRELLPDLRHHVVAGTHYSMLRPPLVGAVADVLRHCLAR